MSAHTPQPSSKDRFKAVVVINLLVATAIMFGLPQCKKCRSCFQQCVASWRDSTKTVVDTTCANNFSSYQEYQDSLSRIMTGGYIIHEPEFSECKASAQQLKTALCH